MPVKRGVTVWILGFLTFLAALNSFGAIILWTRGDLTIPKLYLIGDMVGNLSAENYLWISLTATFIFLGLTCIVAYRKQPPDPEIVKMFVKVGGNLAALRKTQEATSLELAESIEHNGKTNRSFFKKVSTTLEDSKKETFAEMEKQRKAIQKAHKDVVSTVETKVGETREEMLGALKKQDTTILGVRRLNEQSAVALKEQRAELEDIRIRLEKIEEKMISPQPRLNSQDNPEEIKGIGPRFAEDLRSIGITNVGELVTADPVIVAERTRLSPEMASQLQARARLQMIPGIDEKDAELLEEAGISSRSQIARQEPIQLSRRLGLIAETNLQGSPFEGWKPTIEEVDCWIKQAKS